MDLICNNEAVVEMPIGYVSLEVLDELHDLLNALLVTKVLEVQSADHTGCIDYSLWHVSGVSHFVKEKRGNCLLCMVDLVSGHECGWEWVSYLG